MMKASEVIAELTRLMTAHGDLQTLYECQDGLLEIAALNMENVVFLEPKAAPGLMPTPVFVIS